MNSLFSRFLSAADYRLTDGAEYMWHCWSGARYYDCDSNYGHASIVANPTKGEVYQITVYSLSDSDHPYRWTNPEFADVHEAESRERRIDNKIAWEDVPWIDTDSEEDILDKVAAILNNVDFDKRVVIAVELDVRVIARLALLAHEAGITLNEYFCNILRAEVARVLDDREDIR
jgi:hypothetical protein